MSWIFGIINKTGITGLELDASLFRASEKIGENILSLTAGGNETTLFHTDLNEKLRWLVSGVGIKEEAGSLFLLRQKEWDGFFNASLPPGKLNGHFAAVCFEGSKLKLFTDILGLRDIYLYHDSEKVIFSTRVDLLSEFVTPEIDFSQFGGRWILLNQLSTKSIFKNIIRITAGMQVSVDLNSLKIETTENRWLPDFTKKNNASNELDKTLSSLITLPFNNGGKLSLSLSGGMDSRVILAYLLNTDKSRWNTHTFGSDKNPDFIIARRMAETIGFGNEQVTYPGFSASLLGELTAYSSATIINTRASAFLQLNNYRHTKNLNTVIIDGGFGEILRREFLNKLLWKCKNDLINNNIDQILPHLKLFRTDIFNDEINEQMQSGALEQLDLLIKSMPPIRDIEIEDWLDLFSVRTRLPNYYGPEQTRVDGIHSDYMPLVQPLFLEKIFSLPVESRRNGKLSKELIKRLYPGLSKYPLAKGNTTHPFFMNSLQSRVWCYIQRKVKSNLYIDTSAADMLIYLKEYINDTISSKEIIESPVYNYKKVKTIIDGFYNGRLEYTGQVDWWLAFHLFNKSITPRV